MTEKRFRMETISDTMLPFIVDNSTAKKKSDTITTYHIYETHRKEKCLELVDLLNDFSEENEVLKLLSNYRGEMVSFATSLIQDMGSEEMLKMWNDFTESMYQKWKKKRGIK